MPKSLKDRDPAEETLRQGMGQQLSLARKATGLSQERMAARVGITRNNLASIEAGRAEPLASTLRRFCVVLGLSSDALLGIAPVGSIEQLESALAAAHDRARLGDAVAPAEVARLRSELQARYAAADAAYAAERRRPPTPAEAAAKGRKQAGAARQR